MKHALVTATALLLAGCSASPSQEPGQEPSQEPSQVQAGTPATSSASESHASPAEPAQTSDGRPIRLGVLVGSRVRQVRTALEEQGLALDVRRRVTCAAGVVLEQRPAPGVEVERGTTVRVVVGQAPAAATCIVPPGASAVRALRAWALGDGPVPSYADQVRLLVANVPARTLSAAQAAEPGSWTLDVAYAERSDVRILQALATPVRETDVPPHFCLAKATALPDDLVRRLPSSWTLVTRQGEGRVLSCMEVAAVQVWADDAGRITDVNVLMGSP